MWRGNWGEGKWNESAKGDKGEAYILVAHIHTGGGGGGETKRWRDTKNSITGLALTPTFIQHGDTPSLSQLPLTAFTGEAWPTFLNVSLWLSEGPCWDLQTRRQIYLTAVVTTQEITTAAVFNHIINKRLNEMKKMNGKNFCQLSAANLIIWKWISVLSYE